ncbi:MAG: symmetrical bis(5'-nucleosyl)-tetraphosphatase [Kofleriaceae bacterium]|nr:symmetrical bis(5'-nucleosyl)-tetraphosphatase [Kofleriaceae bacterium]MCB9574090.1 symmetrical bis(5'-nucleosyl)-tetraphosphatase [Kofleriaceae bacterium]
MTTWAIGDVQGCMASLERLLERIAFDAARDRLWLVGDLVNRGPRSLDVLRWARAHGDAVTCVLGNHDLHLLGRVAGAAEPKRRDTLAPVLAAPDREPLIDWLRTRPLCHVEGDRLMVHAGLHPRWSATLARALAAELEAELAGPDWKRWLRQLAGRTPPWRDDLTGPARVRAILGFLVRVRTIDRDGVADPSFDGPPAEARAGFRPWFEAEAPAWATHTVVFGHWAALGLSVGPHHLGLDSGCVWGNRLTAIDLDTRAVVQVDAVERRA